MAWLSLLAGIFWIAGVVQLLDSSSQPKRRLVLSQVLFRHSNRTPLFIYKNSPCKKSDYYNGLGAITEPGIHHAYEFGMFLKERYILNEETKFLSNVYHPEHVYARSSDSDRCIQTCQSILAGMFPPAGTRNAWNPELNWYPIAIHSVPSDQDPILRSESSHCPHLNNLMRLRLNSDKMTRLIASKAAFVDWLRVNSGSHVERDTLWDLYQTLEIEILNALIQSDMCKNVSEWATPEVMKELQQLVVGVLDTIYEPGDLEFSRLLGGPLMGTIIQNFDPKSLKKHMRHVKLFFLAAHDSTIYQLSNALNITLGKYVNFLASYLLEVYERPDSVREVELYYYDRMVEGTHLQLVPIPKCPYPCTVNDFILNYSPVISSNRTIECSIEASTLPPSTSS